MQKWLGDNDTLMYSTPERFKKTLKSKIYKKTTGNDNSRYLSYLSYLSILVI